ncbi:hypothetical protein [Lactiplantibacillus herbarum]|uniref:hypothetical protein n=1 Tax=Lactiplantibacillus herbarum TaxID=1670446 RepID=UPI00064FF124|nr:hypothetical protein [Lactiplantibacillus herbarum]
MPIFTVSNAIAISALIFSIYNAGKNFKVQKNQNLYNKKYNQYQDAIKQYEIRLTEQSNKFYQIMAKSNSSASIVPYFYLNLDNEDIEIKKQETILGIKIKNVGIATAVNVQIVSQTISDNKNIYIKSEHSFDEANIYEYLNKSIARPEDSIVFSVVIENKEKLLGFYSFKLRYSDLVGRIYEQEFKFGYDNYIVRGFNLNQTSYQPQLVEDLKQIDDKFFSEHNV